MGPLLSASEEELEPIKLSAAQGRTSLCLACWPRQPWRDRQDEAEGGLRVGSWATFPVPTACGGGRSHILCRRAAQGLETGSVHCPRSHDRTAIQTHICRILKGGPLRDRSLHWPTGSRGPSGRKPQRGGPTSAPRGSFLSSPRLLQSPKGPHCVPAAPVLALSGELGAFTPLLGLSFPRIVVLAFPVGGFKEGVKGHRYPGGAN